MSMSTLIRHRKSLAAVPAAGLTALLLAGCGGGTSAAAAGAPAANSGAGNNANGNNAAGNNGAARTFPGASGQIAAVSGKTLQVQNTTTQTAVKYTDSTKLSQSVTGAQSDLAVGKCISVRSADTGSTTGAPTTTDDSTPVAASSVTISDPVNGTCVGGIGGFGGGGGGGGGGFGGGARGNRGQGANAQGTTGQAQTGQTPTSQAPTGANGRGGIGGRGADGKITKIDGDTVTIEMQQRQFNQGGTAAAGTAASSTPTVTTVSRTVTVSSATTYTKTVSAAASDLKVGKCVTALGSADSNGAITATSISLRPADATGSCTTAMFGGGRRTGAAGGGATTNS
jgi:hypothetical protein